MNRTLSVENKGFWPNRDLARSLLIFGHRKVYFDNTERSTEGHRNELGQVHSRLTWTGAGRQKVDASQWLLVFWGKDRFAWGKSSGVGTKTLPISSPEVFRKFFKFDL